MYNMSIDYCKVAGKDLLVLVDRASGFIRAWKMTSMTTSSTMNVLASFFDIVGYPAIMMTDGAGNFRTSFSEWCSKNNISHVLSSALNPESNGLAERAVATVKKIYLQSKDDKMDF